MCELVDGPSTENLQRAVAPHLGRVYRLPQIGFRASTVYRLYLSIAPEPLCHMLRSEPAHSHAHGHRATFVSVSMAPSRWAFHAASLTSEGAAASSPWAEHGSSNCLRTAVASPHFRPAWSLQSHRGLAGRQPGRGQCSAWRHKARTPTTHCVSQCAPPVQ